MAVNAVAPDALLCLRNAIAAGITPVLTTTSEPANATNSVETLAFATHVQFHHPNSTHQILALSAPTRFEPAGRAVDLRSIIFAWQKRDNAIPDYIRAARELNDELAGDGAAGGIVHNLVFAEKLDLITWLEGASDDSEFLRPLDEEVAKAMAQAEGAAGVAAGTEGGITTQASGTGEGKMADPRLTEIYNGERRMGDRNSILRGIKPTDFSHVHKYAEAFLGRNRNHPRRPASMAAPAIPQAIAQSQNRTKAKRLEPIILLSPSASSLLRMSNIKSFLDNGVYTPPDSASSLDILHVSRTLPSIDPQRPLRFILVDTPDQFKPDYWSRVVAVFTTGQPWQFKSYKWQSPSELFGHALGIYVGWRGEETPATVAGWGRGVISTQIDKYHNLQGVQGRWRDREVVEGVWTAIEESMRNRGWSKEGIAGARG